MKKYRKSSNLQKKKKKKKNKRKNVDITILPTRKKTAARSSVDMP